MQAVDSDTQKLLDQLYILTDKLDDIEYIAQAEPDTIYELLLECKNLLLKLEVYITTWQKVLSMIVIRLDLI